MIPRGVRLNNPTNIRKGPEHWQGLALDQDDPDFFRFTSPEMGLRAACVILGNYKHKHGLDTVEKIISRWAPDSENNTAAYITHCCTLTGFERNEKVDMDNYKDCRKMLLAIVQHENAIQPYDTKIIDKALAMAGLKA